MIKNDKDKLKKINAACLAFLNDFIPENYQDGRYELEDGMCVNIETYTTKERKNCKLEAHKRYIDVQYMISGKELISVSRLEKLDIKKEYDYQKDIVLYKNSIHGEDYLLDSGSFLILTPEEAHMPCVCVDGKQTVRKAVIKIPIR